MTDVIGKSGDGSLLRCPNCRRPLIGDYDKGELLCSHCGLVVLDHIQDSSPEWKALDPEEKLKRVRVGAPRTLALHDFGLTTEISQVSRDSGGNSLAPYMRQSLESMRKWQRRIRTSNSQERGLSEVLSRITEFSEALSLPSNTVETAAHIYRTSVKMKFAKSKSIAGMAAASVYLACRQCGVGRTLKEIAKAANIDKGAVAKYYRLILREVKMDYVPPHPVQKYISKLVNLAHIDTKVERLALSLAADMKDSKLSSGKAPAGLAAAYIYISAVMQGYRLPQREIAEVAEVTEVTVRNRCREILDNFTIRQRLKVDKS
ncbi:MAG: transcription initiation factor IIB [Thaumarchaeota archaeon]|nr:transcription initiation factor IIB [Nitrososphaerota archaeon]